MLKPRDPGVAAWLRPIVWTAALLGASLAPAASSAQQGTIVDQSLDAQGNGYTVLKVWGTSQEMGYAQGYLLASQIAQIAQSVKAFAGTQYAALRQVAQTAVFAPAQVEQEIDGLVAGVMAAQPGAALDKTDIKLITVAGDVINPPACRSHSAWGSFVSPPTKTLSTRRVDYTLTPALEGFAYKHLVLAREPTGGVRTVSAACPAFMGAATAVNEHGTQVSLHDYQSTVSAGAHLPRAIAARIVLSFAIAGLPVEQHLDAAYAALQQQSVMSRGFINYYVPEGHGGVFTCFAGQPCSKQRVPQADYHKGEVLITTNSETDGHSAPAGGEFIDAYYAAGGKKTIADHFALMGDAGIALMSVDYRGRGDMTIWYKGKLKSGTTKRIELEFGDLFAASTQGADAGATALAADAGAPPDAPPGTAPAAADAGAWVADSAAPAGDQRGAAAPATTSENENRMAGGCRVGAASADRAWALLPLLLLWWIARREHREAVARRLPVARLRPRHRRAAKAIAID